MPHVVTVWHLWPKYENLCVPPAPEYATLRPHCDRCHRPHAHDPSIVVDGVVGCPACFPDHPPALYVGSTARIVPRPLGRPYMPPDALAAHTFALLGSHDAGHIPPEVPRDPAHVGTIGERLTLTETCTTVRSLGIGEFGEKFLVIFGASLVWFTGETCWAEEGETYTFKGTVKAHDWYQDRAQTVLTICKRVKEKAK